MQIILKLLLRPALLAACKNGFKKGDCCGLSFDSTSTTLRQAQGDISKHQDDIPKHHDDIPKHQDDTGNIMIRLG